MSDLVASESAGRAPAPRPRGRVPAAPVVYEKLVLVLAALTTIPLVAAAVVVTVRRDELLAGVEAGYQPGAADLVNTLLMLGVVAVSAAYLATTWWLQGIREVAAWANPAHGQRRSWVWVPFGWIFPIVSWWFPYQVVADASRAVGSRVTNFWPWWISWLVLVPAQRFFGQRHSYEELDSAAEAASWVSGYQWGAVVLVISFALWWRIVRSATSAAKAAVTVEP